MPNGSINKAYEIKDAKITFVSLVDKAANKRTFLITKADNENANFTTIGKIIKADKKMHYVTGVVYEPLVEDSQGNFMTEDEIEKAAYYYAKNGNGVDLQHNYKSLDSASVIESYIAKCDMEIDGETVKKGSWLMTVEVDENTFEKVQKGEITGFSMGGVGKYSSIDVDIPNAEDNSAKGLITKLAEKFGIINKGKVTDNYNRHIKEENLDIAYRSLRNYLENWGENGLDYESDEAVIREALTEFNEIVVNLLAESSISKALKRSNIPIEKSGKKISASRLKSLKEVQSKINDIINEANEEETDMTSEQITEAVEKAMAPLNENLEKLAKSLEGQAGSGSSQNEPDPKGNNSESEEITKAIAKAFEPINNKLSEMSETVNNIAKARNLPSNMGDGGNSANKPEAHYMHGLF